MLVSPYSNYYVPASNTSISSGYFSKNGGSGTTNCSNPLSLSITDSGFKLESTTSNQFKLSSYNNSELYLSTGSGNNTLALGSASSYWTTSFNSNKIAFRYNSSSRYISAYNTSPYGFRTYDSTGTNGTAYLSLYHWVVDASVTGIEIKTHPSKTVYTAGETFDPTGLVITVSYDDETTKDVAYLGNESDFSFSPSLSTQLTTDNTSITITYSEQSTSQSITVKSLSSISISGYITSFTEGDTFNFGGTVTAHYSDSSSNDVTSSSMFTGYDMTAVGNQTVTVSFGGKSTTYQISVNAGTLSSISLSGQTTVYVKNSAFSFDGTCTAIFANGYQKSVTPTSISSPDMSTGGVKTVTVSYTYNGKTVSTTYDITVNAYRVVMEASEVSNTYSFLTDNWSNTGTITDVSEPALSGYTIDDDYGIRLASGSKSGSITISTSTTLINKITVYAKQYSANEKSITIDGNTQNNLTDSLEPYTFNVNNKTSLTITCGGGKRAVVSSITIYSTGPEIDIGQSEDCVGLETFISTYLHMDYTDNLGYCKDEEHHYYSTAKTAFNSLNLHQRTLLSSNSAYSAEWDRLSTWAGFNGDSLNSNTLLSNSSALVLIGNNNYSSVIVILAALIFVSITSTLYFAIKSKKKKS